MSIDHSSYAIFNTSLVSPGVYPALQPVAQVSGPARKPRVEVVHRPSQAGGQDGHGCYMMLLMLIWTIIMVNTKYQVVNGDSWFLMMRKMGLYHRGDLFCGLSHPLKEQESLWRTRECIYIYMCIYMRLKCLKPPVIGWNPNLWKSNSEFMLAGNNIKLDTATL